MEMIGKNNNKCEVDLMRHEVARINQQGRKGGETGGKKSFEKY